MELLTPGSPGYETRRAPPIARFVDVRPRFLARCRTAEDVAAALDLARREGLPLAVRSGGHCFAGRSSTEGVVVDVGPMDAIEVGDGVATVGSGVWLGNLYDALAAHGLTVAGGCGTDVGIAGLTLGGGLGLLGRTHGLTCDQLLAARIVLADGREVECDDDLLWLLRGAGAGRAGVVTSLTLRTVPAPTVTVFRLVWPDEHAEAVLDAWQAWAPDTPDAMAASLLVTAPADPARPPVAEAFGSMAAGEAETAATLAGLARLAGVQPGTARYEEGGYREGKLRLGLLGSEDRPAEGGDEYSRSEFFRDPVPAAGLLELLRADRAPGEHRTLDCTPWGGAYCRVPADATAFPHRDARCLIKYDLNVPHGSSARRDWLDASYAFAHPYGTGGSYANFPDPSLDDEPAAYYGVNAARVREVTAAYDPEGVFPAGALGRGRGAGA